MKQKYKIVPRNCRCHPETCSCNSYQVLTIPDEEFVCSGNNLKGLDELVTLANFGYSFLEIQKLFGV